MLIGHRFRQFREAKGLSEAEVAKQIRPDFEESLLWDFESGDDNDIDGWSIQDFKSYCTALGINPADYADLPITDLVHLSLHQLVQKRREEKGYTVTDLSDLIGYEESVIEAIEGGRNDVVVCMHALKEIALWLDIPFRILLLKI